MFRIFRKIKFILGSIKLNLKIIEWRVLFGPRFSVGDQFSVGRFFSLAFDASNSKVSIGIDVQFRDYCQVRSGMNGILSIGNHVFFNNFCSINCFHKIVIGNDCQFGEGVKFYDHNHQYKTSNKLISEQGYSTGSIRIGDNCWFGSDVIVLKDVEIGDNVIVGAGCIIHKSIPSNTIVINKQEQVLKSY